jgi:hypothetical protein
MVTMIVDVVHVQGSTAAGLLLAFTAAGLLIAYSTWHLLDVGI